MLQMYDGVDYQVLERILQNTRTSSTRLGSLLFFKRHCTQKHWRRSRSSLILKASDRNLPERARRTWRRQQSGLPSKQPSAKNKNKTSLTNLSKEAKGELTIPSLQPTEARGSLSFPTARKELAETSQKQKGKAKSQTLASSESLSTEAKVGDKNQEKGEAYSPQPQAYLGKGKQKQLPTQELWCKICQKEGHRTQACWWNNNQQEQKHQKKNAWRPRKEKQLQRDNGDQFFCWLDGFQQKSHEQLRETVPRQKLSLAGNLGQQLGSRNLGTVSGYRRGN